jgi:patatin-related protein
MREKELRLALVCFGGVSLAIYMHGVTKEVLKLIRASQAYHNTPDPLNRKKLTYDMVRKDKTREMDTESVYFDFLKDIGDELDLKVMVDAVAGASAGGMNAVFLARAIAHDLSIDGLRDIWLHEADISRLAVRRKPQGFWTRNVTTPFIKMIARRFMGKGVLSESLGQKLPGLLRFRKMRPPFDGPHMMEVLYDAIAGMGKNPSPLQSLMPAGHRLDLFVTVTDFFGYLMKIPLHDPPVIEEREHRHILHFTYQRWRNGEYKSDLDMEDVPALAFAARATSSFPGAFPPTQIKDVDRLLAERGIKWYKREHFLFNNFEAYYKSGMDPTKTSFLDGSVLNNKPFAQAIKSIQGRAAYREVDRRIIYIDPHPQDQPPPPSGVIPSFFSTLKGALSDIPRNEPIHDDLDGIQSFNKRVHMVRGIILSIKPSVERLVAEIMQQNSEGIPSATDIQRWREQANALAVSENGISYEGYARLKVSAVIEDISLLIGETCGHAVDSPERQTIHDILFTWAHTDPIDRSTVQAAAAGPVIPKHLIPTWILFLQQFDTAYQRRRVRFVIHQLNSLYGLQAERGWQDVDVARLDILKAQFYDNLAFIRRFEQIDFMSSGTRKKLVKAFSTLAPGVKPADFLKEHSGKLDIALASMAIDIHLGDAKTQVDQIFADLHSNNWPEDIRSELVLAYLGFAFWDVITYAIMGTRELGEFNEIRIDRISANDVRLLGAEKAEQRLKGVALAHFGAFFSRKDRENDYLWGRLDGAERLIDILYDSAKGELEDYHIDLKPYKKRAFLAILDEESRHFQVSNALIAGLREQIEKL